MHFRLLGTSGFHWQPKTEKFTAVSSVCGQNLKYESSSRHLADDVKKLHQKACRTCSTIIFLIQPITFLICGVVFAVADVSF